MNNWAGEASPGFKVALILIYPTSLFSDTSYLLTYRIDTSWLTRGDTIKDLWFPLFAWSFKEYITCLQEIPIPLLLMFITPSHGFFTFMEPPKSLFCTSSRSISSFGSKNITNFLFLNGSWIPMNFSGVFDGHAYKTLTSSVNQDVFSLAHLWPRFERHLV